MDIPIAGDPMVQEIMTADHVVVVEDARTDPRTNKAIVAQLHNRTIINVPLLLAEQRLGALGMGTYGDAEGVRPPAHWQIEFMQTIAGHVAVALDRVRFMQARKEAEDALYEEKERLQVTLHAISDAVISTNASGELLYINPAAELLTGWSLTAAVGRPYAQVFRVSDSSRDTSFDAPVPDLVALALVAVESQRYPQIFLQRRDGGSLLVEAAVSPIRDADGEVQGAVLVFRDVTEQRRLSQAIAFQASHDELTGLGNRRAFEQALTQAFAHTRQEHQHHVVCYLDLDDFKVVNDTCGHAAGDELLREIAQLFARLLRAQDHLCRIGGDEFGILLFDQSVAEAVLVAERLQLALAGYRFVWREKSFGVGVSIGMVGLDGASESVGALLQAADSACYVVKDAGDRWVVTHALQWVCEHQDRIEQCSINLSGQSLGDEAFMTFLELSLTNTTLRCDKLSFEVTETAAISNLQTAHHFIETLRSRGCKFSLDDFGSGLSSFAYLRNLPVDVLKIDGQFVKDIAHDPVSLAWSSRFMTLAV